MRDKLYNEMLELLAYRQYVDDPNINSKENLLILQNKLMTLLTSKPTNNKK